MKSTTADDKGMSFSDFFRNLFSNPINGGGLRFSRMKRLNPYHFLWMSILAAEFLTAIITTAVSYILWGKVSKEDYIIGAIDSFFVPVIVVPFVIYFTNQIRTVNTVNDQLMQEIEERKRAEADKRVLQDQLQQAHRLEAIGRLAGGVAHDFNNILSVILGYSDILIDGLPRDSQVAEDVGLIKESGEKAVALTRQLLAFSRKQVLEMQIVNLNSLIENMTKMLGRMIGEDVELKFRINTPTKCVLADSAQIEQVLMNLAVNARDAMPKGGCLIIETSDIEFGDGVISYHEEVKPGRYTLVAMSDTGSGMTHETQEKIFEPFFTTKEKGKGTGLGLATVYGIVKQHNGYIYVYSEPDKGTTFKMYFPAIHGERKRAVEQIAAQKPKGTETLLVVEDEPRLRKYLVDVLEPLGYKLLRAATGEEALKISADYAGDIHLLLTDVVMPGINGRELADTLKKDRPKLHVIYMSGYTDDAIAHHGVLEAGVNFIQKPVTSSKLAQNIREILNAK